MPTASYTAVKALNADLAELSDQLAPLHFHGALSSRFLLDNEWVETVDDDLEIGLFGDGIAPTYLLVVNRRAHAARRVRVEVRANEVVDALTGESLALMGNAVEFAIGAGAFRFLRLADNR